MRRIDNGGVTASSPAALLFWQYVSHTLSRIASDICAEELQYSSLESEGTQALLQRVGKDTAETFFDDVNNGLKIIS